MTATWIPVSEASEKAQGVLVLATDGSNIGLAFVYDLIDDGWTHWCDLPEYEGAENG